MSRIVSKTKKKSIFGILISIFIIILIFCFLPKQKEIDGININTFYSDFLKSDNPNYTLKSQMDKSQIFFSIDNCDSILIGSFFINKNKAFAEIIHFYGVRTFNNNYLVAQNNNNMLSCSKWEIKKNENNYRIIRKYLRRNLFKKYRVALADTLILKRFNKETIITNNRYEIPQYKSVLKYRNVKYGSAQGYYSTKIFKNTNDYYKIAKTCLIGDDVWYKKTLDLYLDIYEPQDDSLLKRPLIVFFHGGAFLIGDKGTQTIKEFGNYFSSLGYVVAAPNYRLGFGLSKGMMKENIERCAYRALLDARASIRYLASNADNYRIDTSQIFIAGNSAGGIIALNVAFMDYYERPKSSYKLGFGIFHSDMGGLDESTNNIKCPFTIKGVINMWGALGDSSIIDSSDITPILSFHGDKDQIVPYNIGRPFEDIRIAILEKLGVKLNELIFDPMYGSKFISDYQNSKCSNTLITFNGYNHDPQYNPDLTFNSNLDTIKLVSNKFIYNNLIPDFKIIGPKNVSLKDKISEYFVPYWFNSQYTWEITGGVILKDKINSNRIKVIWFKKDIHNKVNVCINTQNDANKIMQQFVRVN